MATFGGRVHGLEVSLLCKNGILVIESQQAISFWMAHYGKLQKRTFWLSWFLN
jgi:hypothetical protein